jgi:hypothetical protein
MSQAPDDVSELIEEIGDIVRVHEAEFGRLKKEQKDIVRFAVHSIEELDVERMKRRISG